LGDFHINLSPLMTHIDTAPQALTSLSITIDFADLVKKIRTGTPRPDILGTAEAALKQVDGIWTPAIVYRWLYITPDQGEPHGTVLHGDHDETSVTLNLGHSTRFIKQAEHVLVAAYTAGAEIEREAMKAMDNQEFLLSYILDLIGLLVLEKTGDRVKQLAERKAADLGWRVSPFLSPGSIHGWDLEEQRNLCSLLPLHDIGLAISDDAVLTPFKSLSSMIGIGASYTSLTVGTTCQVCSKKDSCQIKHPA